MTEEEQPQPRPLPGALSPEAAAFVEEYLNRASQRAPGTGMEDVEGLDELGELDEDAKVEAEAEATSPRGLIQWQEATDMRTALTGRWQTFQSQIMRMGADHHIDDSEAEWIEEMLMWWLVEADAASAAAGYTRPFALVQGWQEFRKRAIRFGLETVKAFYGYVSLVNNRLGIGFHVQPHRDVARDMETARELLSSLHYTDVARKVEDAIASHPDGLALVDVAAMMVDQVYNQDRDVIAVVDASDDNDYGNVGIGKSELVAQLAALAAPDGKFDLRHDLSYSIDAIRFDRHMRLAMAKRFEKGRVWGHDEAENVLFDRDHGRGRNKNRVKRFLRIRKRNQIIILHANSIWYLDNKMHGRITWRLRVVDRGWVEVYRTAGRKFLDEGEDKWGKFVTECGYPSLRRIRPDVRALYDACVEVVDEAAAKYEEDEEEGGDVDELPTSPLDDLLKKNPGWGLDRLKAPFDASTLRPILTQGGGGEN